MEIAITVAITMLTMGVCFMAYLAYRWRERALEVEAFVKDPNVTVRDKETEYKDSYEAKVNALEDERRVIHETLMEVFDVLNELPSNPDRINLPQLMQARAKLLTTIQISSYGRDNG